MDHYRKRIELYQNHLNGFYKEIHFSMREIDVISCLLNEITDKEISKILFITTRTVTAHISNIQKKMRLYGRSKIVEQVLQTNNRVLFNKYQITLLVDQSFRNILTEIGSKFNIHPKIIRVNNELITFSKKTIYKKLKDDFSLAKISFLKSSQSDDANVENQIMSLKEDFYYQQCFELLSLIYSNEAIDPYYLKFQEKNNSVLMIENNFLAGSDRVESSLKIKLISLVLLMVLLLIVISYHIW